eukprot:TRINITY_DN2431_c0_g1_i2.p1 TRINITY_DN2431_c0_g1~~TRINITY_DN2431_c0_g1_i2.p1  ORF type:complete len:465 (-),score=61.95 TRINITY_DN2431_c0_g1_i2:354-1628(-)
MAPLVSDSEILNQLHSLHCLCISVQAAMQIARFAPLRVAMSLWAFEIPISRTTALQIMDTIYDRFKLDISSAPLSVQIKWWRITAGTALQHLIGLSNEELMHVFAGWSQSRIKLMLKQGSSNVSALINILPRETDQDQLESLRSLTLAQLNMLAAKENWDGFLTTAVSYRKLCAAKGSGFDSIIDMTDVACMVAFYKMGNLEKARKIALMLDPKLGLRTFEYLDSVNIWNTLTLGSRYCVLKAATKAGSAKNKTKKKKKKSQKTTIQVGAEMSSSSSATSSMELQPPVVTNLGVDQTVLYEPDSKPATGPTTPSSAASASLAVQFFDSSQPDNAASSLASSVSSSSLPTTGINPIGYNQTTQARVVYAACPICYESFPDCLIVPCGHMFCVDCIKQLGFCSICREPVKQWVRAFLPQGEAEDYD